MNDVPEKPSGLAGSEEDHSVRWALIAQCALLGVVFGGAVFCFYECSRIAIYEAMFEEILGGRRPPRLTEWVLQYRSLFVMLAAFVPCAAAATCAFRDRWQAMGALMGLILFAGFHVSVIHFALWLPTH